MADSDLLLKDQSTTPAGFAPESTDQGTNTAGTTVKRSMFGSKDGAQVTIGAKADAAATAPKTAAPWSVVSVLKAIWGGLPALGVAGTPSTDVLTVQNPANQPFATAPAAGENHLGEIGGNSAVAIGTLTRQANTTAYAAGQAVQSSTAVAIALTAARKNGGTGRLTRLRLTKSGTSTTNASFRVHIFKAAPGTLPADAAAFSPSGALDYLGAFPVTMTRAFTDGAKGVGTPEVGAYITFDTTAGTNTLFALIEATAPYVPASGEVFTVALEADRD